MSQGRGSPIVPSHSLVCPYYACKSRIRYVVLARGGHSEKFVWAMLTITAAGRNPASRLRGCRSISSTARCMMRAALLAAARPESRARLLGAPRAAEAQKVLIFRSSECGSVVDRCFTGGVL